MIFSEKLVISVYHETQTKHINTLCEQNHELYNTVTCVYMSVTIEWVSIGNWIY
jgi:hypothetical protein